jgi:hypothetical protein
VPLAAKRKRRSRKLVPVPSRRAAVSDIAVSLPWGL